MGLDMLTSWGSRGPSAPSNYNDDQQTPKSTWFDSNPVGRRQALVGDPSRTNQ